MNDQIDKLEAANTYDIKPMPSDSSIKILPGKWVYARKIDKEGYVTAFKARWVVCGNRQRPQSPPIKPSSVLMPRGTQGPRYTSI